MTGGGVAYELRTWVLLMGDSVSSSSPLLGTPRAADGMQHDLRSAVGNPRGRLEDQISLLPTPAAMDGIKAPKYYAGGNPSLPHAVTLLPTPRAQNGEGRNQTIWARDPSQPQNLENALALLPGVARSIGDRTNPQYADGSTSLDDQHPHLLSPDATGNG
jgi:hypothetical protein